MVLTVKMEDLVNLVSKVHEVNLDQAV